MTTFLEKMTLQKCAERAFLWRENILIALDAGRVIGFLGYGDRAPEDPETGEIFALYVLSEYYGTGVGKLLMDAGLEKLKAYPRVCLWVLKENARAIRFYEKCGFSTDGKELFSERVNAAEIRMCRNNDP